MPILLAALFWLVVTVNGEVDERIGPLVGSQCVLQMAFEVMQAQQRAPGEQVVADGGAVTIGDTEIECKPGERGT